MRIYKGMPLGVHVLYRDNIWWALLQKNEQDVPSARKGEEVNSWKNWGPTDVFNIFDVFYTLGCLQVCIKIESPGGDAPKMFGRHFDEKDMVISKVGFSILKILYISL